MTHTTDSTLNIHARDILDLVLDTYRDGGATLNLRENDGRYVVGNGELGLKFAYNDDTLQYISVTDLADSFSTLVRLIHLARYWQVLGYDTAGMWIHEGQIYVDPGTLCADLGDAIALAKQRGELAIYDTEEQVEIDTSK